MPEEVLCAFVFLALRWDWPDVAAYLLLGFLGMLRPFECIALRPADLSFFGTGWRRQMLVFIGKPKMRRIGPRREHIRIDDAELFPFFEWVKLHFKNDERIFPSSPFELRACFNSLCNACGIPTHDGRGLTPASLRAGGATFWYRATDSTEWGRWANPRMLEVCFQEVAALSIHSLISPLNWNISYIFPASALPPSPPSLSPPSR